MPKSKIILGIDPGLADTGYGVILQDKNTLSVIDYANIKTKAGVADEQRLHTISKILSTIIKKYKPDIASIEEIFFSKNVKTAIVVGQARGAILLTLAENGIPVVEYTPLQIKQALTTYGRADKNQVQQMVKMILGLKAVPKPDDAADALAAAICCANSL
jgi:crossover junction endodeoxyribonuclease RuvC